MERFVGLHRFHHYNEIDVTRVLEVWDNKHTVISEANGSNTTYLVGPAIDRLYDYEELGYTPDELRNIIDKYEQLKRMASSPNGLTRERNPDDWKGFVMHAIDRAAHDKNVSVSVFFRENDVNVSVYPYPDEDEADEVS